VDVTGGKAGNPMGDKEGHVRDLIQTYVDQGWDRRLIVLRWLVDSNGRMEWDRFRRMCSTQWYPLSYYVLYSQLSRDGLVFTKWLYDRRPDEKGAWTYTLIPDEVYPAVKSEIERHREEIDVLTKGG